ncbi:hypothetical protein J3R83DRAFT_13665 [Lanmaoa asiatica]|nr:hypothetical protein J3R83DRAFT_13665 [Lanmaoa asiatica]
MSLDLPHEIVAVILRMALDGTAVPSDILCVCRLFRDVGTDYLYTHLRFTSVRQLHQFALSKSLQPPIAPRSLVIDLTGKAQRGILRHLCDTLVKCQQLTSVAEGTSRGERDLRLKLPPSTDALVLKGPRN